MTDSHDMFQAFDTNGDGVADAYDLDEDGTPDIYDLNGDGVFDSLDSNSDGAVDTFDTNGDGIIDALDTDGDGIADTFDTDGDGIADSFDLNGDGVADAVDTDGDGAVDAFDTNADGIIDALDTDGDGVADTLDTNGDGIADTAVASYDTNGDGVADVAYQQVDTDGDGTFDYAAYVAGYDSDGDGVADSIYQQVDANGDGAFETEQIVGPDEWAPYDSGEELPSPDEVEGTEAGYEQFDSSENDMSKVVGDPDTDGEAWAYQGNTQACAVYSQCAAFENITGQDVDVEQVIEHATEEGWYDPETGTTLDNMDKVLEYLGADTEMGDGGSLDDLKDCLEDGGRIVVAVDADEIWSGNPDAYLPNEPNHVIEVIGIDYSGEEPMVIINDSGTADGSAAKVPADVFMDAWEDSDFHYVEAYA